MIQQLFFDLPGFNVPSSPKGSLLKWIGSKHRLAPKIVAAFPRKSGRYYEPFVGSAGVLATLVPERAVASDTFKPLIEIWTTLKRRPSALTRWYEERWYFLRSGDKRERYEAIRDRYNENPNGADLLFLCRSCYGGVVRFRKADGHMSTPCGVHNPISPESFARRVDDWVSRLQGVDFLLSDYEDVMQQASRGDLIYCDPPYSYSQSILYGAQDFNLEHLLEVIDGCKRRGVYVALSIDGSKRSGDMMCDLPLPNGLFEREILVDCGRSMLKRFQMTGRTLEKEVVADRLLLTY